MVSLERLVRKRILFPLRQFRIALHRRNILRQINGGDGLHLNGMVTIVFPANLTVGKDVHIGRDSYINCRGCVEIGDHTIISHRVTIYSYNHNFKDPSRLPYDRRFILEPVVIGKYVWIGMNVTVAPGTVVGDGAVIGMGTVLCGRVPENAVIVGAKARIVGYRNRQMTHSLADEELFYRFDRQDDNGE